MSPILSIIIPTLNEQQFLSKGTNDLMNKASKAERLQIIIVDAGSTDKTIESIADQNVQVFSKPEFQFKKYASLNFGIEKSEADVILFLDADTILPYHFDRLILNEMINEKCVGGAFEFAFQNADWKFRIIEFINRIRYRFSKIYYGDQAIFCRKEAAVAVGGFSEKRLMEAAYFCQNLKKMGRISLIKRKVKTSPRRFVENGFLKVCWFDLTMWVRFILNLSVDEYGEKYWSANLKSND